MSESRIKRPSPSERAKLVDGHRVKFVSVIRGERKGGQAKPSPSRTPILRISLIDTFSNAAPLKKVESAGQSDNDHDILENLTQFTPRVFDRAVDYQVKI